MDGKPVDVWDAVQRDMRERQQVGLARYGKPVAPDDAEDWLQHQYEELLDAAVYCKAEILRRAGQAPAWTPADDGEPATEEWAKALGEWSQYTSSSGVRWYHGPADVYLRFDANGCEMGVGCVGETQYLLSDPTRGHVRRLCAVAGSPLKEPAKP